MEDSRKLPCGVCSKGREAYFDYFLLLRGLELQRLISGFAGGDTCEVQQLVEIYVDLSCG